MRISLRSFPSGTPAPRNTECITTQPTPKSVPTVGWIRVVFCQRVDSQQLLTQYSVQSWRSFARLTTQAPNSSAYLDDWYLWIKPQCLLQTIAVITAATRSVNLALQTTKTQIWKGSCQDPILEFQDKVTITLSCLGGHLQIHEDTEPSPVVSGEQATMEKTTHRFQKIATTLADLNAEGLNVQTVNDLLTMYVGAASQHVLRVSFVPDKRLKTSTDRLSPSGPVSCIVTLLLRCFLYTSNLVDLEWDLLFNDMRLPHGARGSHPFSGHRFTFQFNATTTNSTCATPNHPFPTNE